MKVAVNLEMESVCFLCEAISSKWQGVCAEATAEELSKVGLSGREWEVITKGHEPWWERLLC